MPTVRLFLLATAMIAGPAIAPVLAASGSLVALTASGEIAVVDTGMWAKRGSLELANSSAPVVGIDVGPATGELYVLQADGWLSVLDPGAGTMMVKGRLPTMPAAGSTVSVDFNPAADKLRIVGSDGVNLRADVDKLTITTDKPLTFAASDMHAGEAPNIVAAAYTNSVKETEDTVLYDVDATIGGLIKQAPPNDGVLNAVGKLGVAVTRPGFDIQTDAAGRNWAWLVSGTDVHTVDLASGKATRQGMISGIGEPIVDIAVMPSSSAAQM